jgi:hypothetical protein
MKGFPWTTIFAIIIIILLFFAYRLWYSQPLSPGEGNGDIYCIQVITSAQNPETGECREFPTPCDVPPGWVGGCPVEPFSIQQLMSPISPGF